LASPVFVRYEYRKVPAPEACILSDDERLEMAMKIVKYIHGKEALDNVQTYLTEKELSHLSDVSLVLKRARILQAISDIALVLSSSFLSTKGYRSDLRRSMILGSIVSFSVFFTCFLIALMNFRLFFIWLHSILFPPGSWMFNPTSILIQLFPEGFWIEMFRTFLFLLLVESSLALLSGFFL